jgi:hypothetical protein
MNRNLKALLIFTMIYGAIAVGMLSMHPESASLRVADGLGNFEVDAASPVHMAMVRAE